MSLIGELRGAFMRVDVIGGSGFIGTRLCKRLQRRSDVQFRIIDKAASAAFDATAIADVRSHEQLQNSIRAGGVIVNLAAEHRDDVRPSSLYYDVNVQGARNICEVAREKDTRTIVFTSTVAVYGFAPVGTSESGVIAPFNEYGRTKHQAELVLQDWQAEAPDRRTLVIVRPTVVFGEQNRGNVFNLFRQIATGRFFMVGGGENRKSLAYVENVAAFIEWTLSLPPGVHVFNYADKPDFAMNDLVCLVKAALGRSGVVGPRVPFPLALLLGRCFDLLSLISGVRFPVSSVRVRKFCSNSVYESSVPNTGFDPPVPLKSAVIQTIKHEFIDKRADDRVFHSE